MKAKIQCVEFASFLLRPVSGYQRYDHWLAKSLKISQLAFGADQLQPAAHALSGVLPKVPRAQHRLICLNPPQHSTRRPGGAVQGLGASAAQPEG